MNVQDDDSRQLPGVAPGASVYFCFYHLSYPRCTFPGKKIDLKGKTEFETIALLNDFCVCYNFEEQRMHKIFHTR